MILKKSNNEIRLRTNLINLYYKNKMDYDKPFEFLIIKKERNKDDNIHKEQSFFKKNIRKI